MNENEIGTVVDEIQNNSYLQISEDLKEMLKVKNALDADFSRLIQFRDNNLKPDQLIIDRYQQNAFKFLQLTKIIESHIPNEKNVMEYTK